MKKVFSLLLVVAMLLSMSTMAFAAQEDIRMIATITETDTDITVVISVKNVEGMSSFTSYLSSTTTTLVPNSWVVGEKMAAGTLTTPPTKYPTKFVCTLGAESLYFDAAEATILTYKVTKNAGVDTISAADFEWLNGTLTQSKVVCNTTINSKNAGSQFLVDYVDARTPIVEEPEFGYTLDGTNVTCYGKLDATQFGSDYGVEFTAASTVEGARAQRYAGAKLGDVIGGNTVVLDGWDGTFEIVLQGIHAGAKEFKFYIGEGYATDAFTFTVE